MAEFTSQIYNPDSLLASAQGVWDRNITIASGQVLTRGSVLGQITSSGEYVLSLSAAVDGSEVPAAILTEDIDASAGAIQTPAYMGGFFIESSLVLGTGHTLSSIFNQLRGLGIKLVTSISA